MFEKEKTGVFAHVIVWNVVVDQAAWVCYRQGYPASNARDIRVRVRLETEINVCRYVVCNTRAWNDIICCSQKRRPDASQILENICLGQYAIIADKVVKQ